MPEIYAKDKPTLIRSENQRRHTRGHGIPHGVEGHTGYRCGFCALLRGNITKIESDSGDYWQDLQIAWQEECDIVFRLFDDQVAAHFPEHLPQNCQTCPNPPPLPAKPLPPQERRWSDATGKTDW